MATSDIAQQLVEAAQKDPSLISKLTSDPSSAVKSVTGLDLSDQEITEAVTCATKLAKGEKVDMGTVASLAADLFSKHGGDLTAIMGSLLGTSDSSEQSDTTTQQSDSAETTTSGKKKRSSKKTDSTETSDSSDSSNGGIDIGEVANIAETLLGGSSSSSSSSKKKKSDGLDLGEIANIAEGLFGGK